MIEAIFQLLVQIFGLDLLPEILDTFGDEEIV